MANFSKRTPRGTKKSITFRKCEHINKSVNDTGGGARDNRRIVIWRGEIRVIAEEFRAKDVFQFRENGRSISANKEKPIRMRFFNFKHFRNKVTVMRLSAFEFSFVKIV